MAEHPDLNRRPSRFPYPLKGQAFEFRHEFEETHYAIYVAFVYGQDEATLHVLYVAVQQW